MKRIRFALLSIITISLLMNLPNWFSGWNNSSLTARVAARPFSIDKNIDIIALTEPGGDDFLEFQSFRTLNPSEPPDHTSIEGLFLDEFVTAIEAIPNPPGLNSIAEGEMDFTISAITNRGNLYNIDCATGNATLVALIDLLRDNQRLSYTFNPDTGVGLVLNPDAGLQMAINPFTGQVLGSGPVNFFYPEDDALFGVTPNVITWATSTADYDLDGDVDLFYYDKAADSLGEIGPDGSLHTIQPLGLPEGTDFVSMDSLILDFAGEGTDAIGHLSVLGQGQNENPTASLFSINLNTGSTIDLGSIGDGSDMFKDIALVRSPAPLCDLVPSASKLPIGSTVMGTISPNVFFLAGQDGMDQYGLEIEGPNAGTVPQLSFVVNGLIFFQYTSNGQPGTDTIRSNATFGDTPFSCEATVEWKELLIEGVKQNKGKTGENIVVTGFNFQQGDIIFINGVQAQKTKFKAGSGKLVARNGERLLNPCPDNIPGFNRIEVMRSPGIADTFFYSTCP